MHIEILPPDRVDNLARVLFEKMEHLDPSETGDIGWEAQDEYERQFYRSCVGVILAELEFTNDNVIDGRSKIAKNSDANH